MSVQNSPDTGKRTTNVERTSKKRRRNLDDAGPSGMLDLLRRREVAPYLQRPSRHSFSSFSIPSTGKLMEELDSRAYIGRFSEDGDLFYTATQDWRISCFSVYGGSFQRGLSLQAIPGQWTLTDTDKWGPYLAYSSITPTVYVTRLDQESAHTPLQFDSDHMGRFGLWCLRFASDGSQIVAGSSDQSVYVMDVVRGQLSQRIVAHEDDVNAVCFADGSSTNVLISGSDDGLIKVWDRRALSNRPQGCFVGHTEGITYVDSKGDGRWCVSNGKDMKLKTWDIRRMAQANNLRSYQAATNRLMKSFDYRFQAYPANPYKVAHPNDCSVQTFIGHAVQKTLIRCHFSPQHTSGGRYVYTGSADGLVHIYDTLSGETARVLDANEVHKRAAGPANRDPDQDALESLLVRFLGRSPSHLNPHMVCVRDVSWHPDAPMLASTAWTREGGAIIVHDRF